MHIRASETEEEERVHASDANNRARILFVDDEKRVLNSMRGMFRRDFDLFLTTEGAAAVKIASETPIDVIVADQRMPGMTGIEVLGKVKDCSPDTIRILLTGYADPSAVEGSINIGEVFRFLGKPCPPKLLRETLDLAISATRPTQAVLESDKMAKMVGQNVAQAVRSAPERIDPQAAGLPTRYQDDLTPTIEDQRNNRRGQSSAVKITNSPAQTYSSDKLLARLTSIGEVAFAWDSYKRRRDTDTAPQPAVSSKEIGVVLYTVDTRFAESAIRALAASRSTTLATSLLKVMQAVEQNQCGVLVTDISVHAARLQKMIAALKQVRPELVTIVVSDTSDTTDMVSLINYGQIYRYIRKPVAPNLLKIAIEAAAAKSLDLRENPGSVHRHTVATPPIPVNAAETLNQVLRGNGAL